MHDTTSYNAVITSGVDFSMVTVRYGKITGTAAVAVHIDEIQEKMFEWIAPVDVESVLTAFERVAKKPLEETKSFFSSRAHL